MVRRRKHEAEEAAEVEKDSGVVAAAETPTDSGNQPDVVADDVAAEVSVKDMSDLQRAHYNEICKLNHACLQAGYFYENKKSETNHAKKQYELLQNKLNSLIAQGANPQRELPFEDPEGPSPELWRDVPIGEAIQMTEKQAEKLEAAGVKTVGQFEHLRSGQMDGFPDGLRSVKGIGEKTVDEWEDQILDWMSVNAREVEPKPETEGTDDAGTEQEEV
jgi:hypothetical protein